MKTLIIIPTYNEIENIKELVECIFQKVDSGTEVLIVDDNSPDGTGDLADVLSQSNPRIHVLHRPGKLGLGTAYVAGFKYAIEKKFDVIFEMDSDFSHDPQYLPAFQETIKTCDAVIGSRYVAGGGVINWGIGRRVLSRGGSLYSRFVLGIPYHDLTGGYNCWKRQVIEAIGPDQIRSDGYSFQIEMKYKAHKLGFKIKEIPIVFEDRHLGKSKMNKKIVLEAIYKVLWMRLEPVKTKSKREETSRLISPR